MRPVLGVLAAFTVVVFAVGGCAGNGADHEGESPDGGPDAADAADLEASPDAQPTDSGDASAPDAGACAVPFEDRQWGGERDDELLGLAADAFGRVYAAGYVDGTVGVENDGPTGDATGFVSVLDRSRGGFTFELVTPSADVVDAVVAHEGGFVFAGRTRGAIPGAVNAGKFDLVLGRVSAGGVPVWLGQYGLAPPEQARRVAIDGLGRILVAGYQDAYVPTNFVLAWENPFVAAIGLEQAPSGPLEPIFVNHWQTSPTDFAYGLAALADGRSLVTGAITGGTRVGAFLAELDAEGSLLRDETWSPGPMENLAAVVIGPDGDPIVAGSTFRQLGDAVYGDHDVFVAKLDPLTFGVRWVTQLGSSAADWVEDMVVDEAGNVIVVGETFGSFVPGTEVDGASDAFVAFVGADGRLQGREQFGSGASDVATRVVLDACGSVIVGGRTSGALVAGARAGGRLDAFVVAVPRP